MSGHAKVENGPKDRSDQASQIVVPPRIAPAGHRLMLNALRAAPLAQWLGFRMYNRFTRTIKRHRYGRTFFGAKMRCDINDLISMCIYHFGVWEPHISALIRRRLGPGDVFCDVGANIGYYSLLASQLVGSNGKVVAIEPSPSIFDKLSDNLRLNGVTNVRSVQVAVAAAAGTFNLYRGAPRNASMASTAIDRGFGKEADVIGLPLYDILTAEEREKLRFIKIDVEGSEGPILRELIDTSHLYRSDLEVMVELSSDGVMNDGERDNIVSRFCKLGFRPYSIPNSYDIQGTYLNLAGVLPPQQTPLPIRGHQDILFSRSQELAASFSAAAT